MLDDSPRTDVTSAPLPQPTGGNPPPVVIVTASGRQTVWWVMTVVLAVIATALVARLDEQFLAKSASAQNAGVGGPPMVGARGIYAFTGQLDVKSYGVFMLDVDTGTLWCYEMDKSRDGLLRLRLAAARSWIFDRYLEEFNVAAPTPSEVRALVRQQQSHTAMLGGVGNSGGGASTNANRDDDSDTAAEPPPVTNPPTDEIRAQTRPSPVEEDGQ